MTDSRVRHIVNLSGGKDSTALAIYLRDRLPDLEYLFCDTEKELPETYEYLDRLEAYLGRKITRLKHDGRGFDHHLILRRGYLPSARMRWCTEELKIKPFEKYVGRDQVLTYVGIRADEDRDGYISHRPNVKARFPFKEDGITKQEVMRILRDSGLGLPSYYRWRSRSGCYFCFFQQRIEWVGLLENHPDLYALARRYERFSEPGQQFTWVPSESLDELARPERIAQIRTEHARRMELEAANSRAGTLYDLFAEAVDAWETDRACTICDV